MKTKMKILILLSTLALILLPTRTALAQDDGNGQVVLAGSYTLLSGETLRGGLVVIGGQAEIEEDAQVRGDTLVIGGALSVDGEIRGNIVILGGLVSLGGTAVIRGDITNINGTLMRDPGSTVTGDMIDSGTLNSDSLVENDPTTTLEGIPAFHQFWSNFDPIGRVLRVIGWAILLGLTAMLMAALMGESTQRIGRAAFGQPFVAGGLGLLTMVVLPLALILLTITFILIPVALLVMLIVPLLLLYGWLALGTEIGLRLMRMSNSNWSLPLAAGLGTFLMTLVANGFTLLPCVGGLVPLLVSLVGLGAVFMTRFGTQEAPSPARRTAEPVPAAPALEAAPAKKAVPSRKAAPAARAAKPVKKVKPEKPAK